jgi:arabinogalactan oligomer/maltooligosaccharide transport system substrate-binding protein
MVINGPWALGDYETALGEGKVGVAPLPTISEAEDAPAKPFLGLKHIMLNANADDDQTALAAAFMTWFTGPDSEKFLAEKAGHLPAHTGVDVSADPIAQAFVTQAETATPLPTIAEMGQVWEPAQQMITKVLAGEATPEEAAAEAQDTINQNIETMREGA